MRSLPSALVAVWVALVAVWSPRAWAEPVSLTLTDLVGRTVSQVSLEAPEGGLPRENLEPLLRMKQEEALDIGHVRLDVALLYRAGGFASVEAIATPWFLVGPDGEIEETVNLTYRVLPPPRLVSVEVEGPSRVARRIATRALGLTPGDPLYPDADLSLVEEQVERALGQEGWWDPDVRLRVEDLGGMERALAVTIRAGDPMVWGEVTLAGADVLRDGVGRRCRIQTPGCRISRWRVRRVLRRHGVVEGRRLVRADLDRALVEVRDTLTTAGWLNARVTQQLVTEPGEKSDVLLNLEGRDRLAVDLIRTGRTGRLPRGSAVQPTLGLYEGTRSTEATAEEAERRLRRWLDDRGHVEAQVAAALEEGPQGHVLRISAEPGPRHKLHRIDVDGSEAFTARFLAAAMREADPDGLEDGVVSSSGVDRGLDGLEEFYRGQGFLDARVELEEMVPKQRWWSRVRSDRRRVLLEVQVHEGPRTTLAALEVAGLEDRDPGAAALSDARAELVGDAYRPARIEVLARTITDAWRQRGHLGADVRVESRLSEDRREAEVLLRVEPGPQVRLRSVVIQGNRRTRRRVIDRELALTVGEPVTPEGIRSTRSNLYDLDLFRVVAPELVGEDDRYRDLLILLDEKPNLLFETGGGLSTDQGVRVRARATHRNLGGLAHKLTLFGQVGYGWFGDDWRLDLDEPVWQAAARYSAPHLPTPNQSLVVEGVIGETLQEPVFRLWRTGVSVGVRTRLARWEGFVAWRAQVRRLEDVEQGALVRGDPWVEALGLEPDGTGQPRLPSASRLVTGPTMLLFRDGRDDRFNPTKGNFVSTVVEVSDGLANQVVTARGLLRMEQLLSLGPLVLNLGARMGGGWVQGGGATLPLEERFYLGGSGSLRGFRLNTVGPANYAGRNDVPFPDELAEFVEGAGLRQESARWVPTGGDAMASGTVEMRVPLTLLGFSDLDSTQWVLFTDVGRLDFIDPVLAPTSQRRGRDQLFRTGVGTGLRIATPVGPAAVDLGFNPWPQPEREESRIVAHLSLGEL